jgi:hypothetical protein
VLPAYLTNEKLLAILPAVFGLAAVANAVLTDRGRGSTGSRSDDTDTGEEARRRAARSRSPVTARLRARGASVA